MSALRSTAAFVWRTLGDFMEHGCMTLAAALAFYAFFSLPGLFLLLLTLVGVLVDPLAVQTEMYQQITRLVGRGAAEQVEAVFLYVMEDETRPRGITVLSAFAVAFGATAAFAALQEALDRIWSVERDPSRGTLRNFLMKRVFSFGVILVVGFLLLVSLILSAVLAAIGGATVAGTWPVWLLWAGQSALTLAIATVIFTAIFKWIPDVEARWRDIWVGGLVTAVLFVAGQEAIGLYLGNKDLGKIYGAAGSLALFLLWVYYSSNVVLLGAEVTRRWQEEFGRAPRPSKGAVSVVSEVRKVP